MDESVMADNFLIVDDDPLALDWLRQGFQKRFATAQVFTAPNGIVALAQLKKIEVRLVITDLMMPEMDGFELVTRIMTDYPGIPVIAITGNIIPEAKRQELKNGTLAVLFKPFGLQELDDTITQILNLQAEGGALYNIAPSMFLQLVNLEQKTCTIRATEQNTGRQGVLFFCKGRLMDARTVDLQGEPAACEIFSWENISLMIQNSCPVKKQNVVKTLNALLLEAARMKDEQCVQVSSNVSAPESVPEVQDEAIATPAVGSRLPARLVEKLEGNVDLKPHLKSIQVETQWHPLLAGLADFGDYFQTGALQSVTVSTGLAEDVIVIPAENPIAIRINSKYPKDKVLALIAGQ
jgi:CheY-like chemotaxis protein